MSYRFNAASLPGPTFTASRFAGAGLFITTPEVHGLGDGDREQLSLARGRKKGTRIPYKSNLATGELARLLSGTSRG